MYRTLDRIVGSVARLMAYAGGAILIALTFATCISIAGRALVGLDLGFGPIRGIYDMTEIGVAAAVFLFLPWCQYSRGHATVELMTPVFGAKLNRVIDVVVDSLMLLVAAVGAWRLYLGMLDKMQYGETTLILQFPVWQAYLASLVGAVGFAVVAAFCVLRAVRALSGNTKAEASPGV